MTPRDFNSDVFIQKLFSSKISNFDDLALELFAMQQQSNEVYRNYIAAAKRQSACQNLEEITFLPAAFFKTHRVVCGPVDAEAVFSSSGTTGSTPALHYVKSLAVYNTSYLAAFQAFYGNVSDFCVLALLPSYLERTGSSLVAMAEGLIRLSGHPLSGFYLHDFDTLAATLQKLKAADQKTILLGVTFALLDFADTHPASFPHLIVMETGGMKGRSRELVREEVHQLLKTGFDVEHIHSEYGMTELLSQCYATHDGKLQCPSWVKIIITDPGDPFAQMPDGKTGIINVIDLANIHSCAFIQTADVGRKNADGTFEVLGRLDNSDLRGCSLLYA